MNRKLIDKLWQKAEKTLYALYGDMADMRILNRFYSEKMAFFGSDVIILWNRVGEICAKAASRNHLARVRGTVGSCFTAYLLGATENNPLPLHYSKDGEKEDIGNYQNKTVINALKRYRDFALKNPDALL